MQESISQGGAVVSKETVSADFVTRLIAYLIDWVIIVVPIFVVMLIVPMILGYMVGLVASIGYVLYFWTTTGQTVGKMVMGLKVVNAETGQILTVQEAAIRYVCYIVSAIPFYLGFLWAIWDPNHDTWHDKLAKTKVIRIK